MASKNARGKSFTFQEMVSLCLASDSSDSEESEGEIDSSSSSLEESLFHRTHIVEIDNVTSSPFPLLSGVPQGLILGPLLFILYFNDLPDSLIRAKVIMYADDTVIYYADPDINNIEMTLNIEMKSIYTYLADSELIINLKKGKTETMLFGTAKKLAKVPKEFEVKYSSCIINVANEYNYLGNTITPTLSFDKNFQLRYKKASSRVNLLSKVREYLTRQAAEKVYQTMIAPLMLYCCLLNLKLSTTQKKSLASIESRASSIIYTGTDEKVKSIYNDMNIKGCL